MGNAKATAIFDGNDRPLQATIKKIKGSLNGLQRSFRAGASNLAVRGLTGLGVAGVAAGFGLAVGVKRALDLGSELQDMSDKTGIAVDQILILREAAKDNGIEDITGAVGKMQKSLIAAVKDGVSPAAEALDRLGLSAVDLAESSPVDAIDRIGERIAAIENPTLRAATAMEIFGKSGASLLPLFKDRGALSTAARSLGDQARLLRENSGTFDAVSDRLRRSGLKLQGFTVGVAAGLLPALDKFTAKFDKIDLAGQGERFGAALQRGADAIAASLKGVDVAGGAGKVVEGAAGIAAKVIGFGRGVAKGVREIGSSIAKGTLLQDLGVPTLGGSVARDDSGLNAILEKRIAATMQKTQARAAANPMLGWKAAHTWDMKSSASRLGGGGLRGASSAMGDEAFSRVFRSNNDGKALSSALNGPSAATGGAYNIIRRGDAARAKNMEKEKEKKRQEELANGKAQLGALGEINETLKEGLL